MPSAFLAPQGAFRSWDNNGNPLVGGLLNTYAAGTNNPIATYTDSTAATPNANPVVLNARGEANVWLLPNTAYKFVLTDSAANPIWTQDNIVNSQLLTLYGGVDTGNVNAYVLNFQANFTAYADGIVIYWIPSHTNTAASTVNVNGLGAVSILRPDGTAVSAGNIIANQAVGMMYKSGSFLLLSVPLVLYGGTSTNASNAYSLTYSANFGQYNSGIIIYWVPNASNTGASTLNVNGLGALPIVNPDGSAIGSGVLQANSVVTVVLIGSNFVLLTSGYATFTNGSFAPAWTGFSAAPNGNALWSRVGNIVTLTFGASGTGTSNANSMSFTNLPAAIQPSTGGGARSPVMVTDNGAVAAGAMGFGSSGVVNFYIGTAPPSSTGFTVTGSKGMAFGTTLVYAIV